MVQKLLIPVISLIANFIIVWYANFAGKLPSKGTYLGFTYDSVFIRAVVTQFEYLWVLIIINALFTFMFSLGLESFKNNFLGLTIMWLAMGPIAALIFNNLVLKQSVTAVAVLGIFFVVVGVILVTAQKEIISLLK